MPGPGGGAGPGVVLRWPSARRAVALSVLVGMVSCAAVVVQALALAHLLAGAFPGARHGDRATTFAWLALGVAVRGACALVSELSGRLGAMRTQTELRRRLVGAALRGAPARRSGTAGDVATLAGHGLDGLDAYLGRCLPDLVLAVLAPLSLAVVVGALDWVSGIVVVVAIVLFPVFGALVGRASTALAADRWRQVEGLGRHVVDLFEGLAEIRAFGRVETERRRIEELDGALRRASLATLRTAFLSALVLDTLASVSVALVAVPLGLRLLGGAVHLGTALAVLIIAPEVFLPLRRASAEFHDSTEGMAALAAVLQQLDAPAAPAPGVPASAASAPHDGAVAALLDVRVVVPGRAAPVLDGASLAVGPGETVALVGANGAGKSTTLALLLGFAVPASGAVTAHGVDLRSLDPDAWRRQLTYLPEHPALVAGTLADNLRLADPGADDGTLVEALRAVGAEAFLSALPWGLATPLGDGGRPVSTGERQRIALARTLLRPASLYLLDEPTAHLDPDTEAAVVEHLRHRLEGRSAVVVTHRPAVIALADRVLTIAAGRVVEVGTGPAAAPHRPPAPDGGDRRPTRPGPLLPATVAAASGGATP